MGPALSEPLSVLSHLVKLAITINWIYIREHSSQVQFKFLFPIIHRYNTHKRGVINYCEEDKGLLKYDIIEDCLRFWVEKFMILSLSSDTWEWASAVPFLKR